jgi:hypothetical protein
VVKVDLFVWNGCLFIGGNDDGIDSNNGETKKRISESKEEAAKLMARVPGLRQKIAGKSIPLEVHFLFFYLSFFPFSYSVSPFRNSSHIKLVNSNHKINI